MAWAQGFEPKIDAHSRLLILGSMPGVKSLHENQYYAHARNAFWPIVEALFGIDGGLDYDERLVQLNAQQVALWDVYHRCYRPGSLDSNINKSSGKINDFVQLFQRFDGLRWVFFNGKAAEQAFTKAVIPELQSTFPDIYARLSFSGLPSTSPANAAMSFEQKLIHWQAIKPVMN